MRHDLGTDRVEVRGELGQQAGVLVELEPEPAAQPQVIVDVLGERVVIGALLATVRPATRSRCRSTLA